MVVGYKFGWIQGVWYAVYVSFGLLSGFPGVKLEVVRLSILEDSQFQLAMVSSEDVKK